MSLGHDKKTMVPHDPPGMTLADFGDLMWGKDSSLEAMRGRVSAMTVEDVQTLVAIGITREMCEAWCEFLENEYQKSCARQKPNEVFRVRQEINRKILEAWPS